MDTSTVGAEEMMKVIISEWSLDNLPEDQQMEMVDKIGDLVYQSVLLKAVDMLDENGAEEFDTLVDTPGTDAPKVLAFFEKRIPNFDELVAGEVKAIKDKTVHLIK
jgi:hypothetical protein